MSEHEGLSRLPSDPVYWERLEARVLENLDTPVVGLAQDVWWAPLAERAYSLGAFALAAGIAAAVLLPSRTSAPLGAAAELLRPPAADPALISPLAADAPPSLDRLVFPRNQEQSR